ncbi:MAG: hypothetical protein LBH90_02000 [Tannerella sp.]|nr:hypothetical protein [Tannerella sp.]
MEFHIKSLEVEPERERMRSTVLKKLIDVTWRALGVDIRKKFGDKQKEVKLTHRDYSIEKLCKLFGKSRLSSAYLSNGIFG